MKTEILGKGKPYLTFVVGVHGNEQAPIRGIELLKKYLQKVKFLKGFKVIYANSKAIGSNKRFIDKDLNRSFPGKAKGSYERKLAYRLTEELKNGNYTFDFHSTLIATPPYGVIAIFNQEIKKILTITGIANYIFNKNESLIKHSPNSVAFEVGQENDPNSAVSTFHIMKNILNGLKIIAIPDGIKKAKKINIFLVYNEINRKVAPKLDKKIKDFKFVKGGAIVGYKKNGIPTIAHESFYPIFTKSKNRLVMSKKIKFLE